MTEKRKSLFAAIILIGITFLVSFLWRKYRDDDIKSHSRYTFGRIEIKRGSLKNGNQWYYDFFVNGNLYQGYRSTHVDYDVKIGDYFLVNYSSVNPQHNKILYDYRLKSFDSTIVRKVYKEIPFELVENAKKGN
jgi:hypothetical protein